ncbi:hypothetical protein ACQ86F_20460 [Streptomyces venezuelae ATCC 10712]
MTLLDCTLRTGGRLTGGSVPPRWPPTTSRSARGSASTSSSWAPSTTPPTARPPRRAAAGPAPRALRPPPLRPPRHLRAARLGRRRHGLRRADRRRPVRRAGDGGPRPPRRPVRPGGPRRRPLHRLREAGFGVCLFLTHIDLASHPELDRCLGESAALGPLDAVFLVDSLGSLRPERVIDLVQSTRAALAAPVGIHAHDNQGFALHNTVVAGSAGATWQDAAVHGIGSGAGLTRTEQLLALLGATSTDLAPLLSLIATHVAPLKRRYGWGPARARSWPVSPGSRSRR